MRDTPGTHGDDHAPGGPDPLNWLTSTASVPQWPTLYTLFPWLSMDTLDNDYTQVIDLGSTGSLFGAYGQTTALDASSVWPVRLGPEGSRWGIHLRAHQGLDFGLLDIQFASADEDLYGAGLYPIESDGSLTWVTLGGIGVGHGNDTYRNPALKNVDFYPDTFRVAGAAGDPLTDIASADILEPSSLAFDGGPGFYLMRIKTTGKNASSTSYRSQVVALHMLRMPG